MALAITRFQATPVVSAAVPPSLVASFPVACCRARMCAPEAWPEAAPAMITRLCVAVTLNTVPLWLYDHCAAPPTSALIDRTSFAPVPDTPPRKSRPS